jgi:organic hydroperoxide reductase OsmC/OhrA
VTGLEAAAVVRWEGWGGEVEGSSGALAAPTSTQAELGGPGEGTNPEELFSAAIANCLTSTLTALARSRGIPLESVETRAQTRLEWGEEKAHHLARARLSVRARSPADAREVHQLIVDAREHCPVCNAVAGNVPLLLEVSIERADARERVAAAPESSTGGGNGSRGGG